MFFIHFFILVTSFYAYAPPPYSRSVNPSGGMGTGGYGNNLNILLYSPDPSGEPSGETYDKKNKMLMTQPYTYSTGGGGGGGEEETISLAAPSMAINLIKDEDEDIKDLIEEMLLISSKVRFAQGWNNPNDKIKRFLTDECSNRIIDSITYIQLNSNSSIRNILTHTMPTMSTGKWR